MEYLIDLYNDIDSHLLNDKKPSVYMGNIPDDDLSKYPFVMLYDMKNTEQSLKHHPEGSVWNHTMLVLDCAAGMKEHSSDEKVFMWAALLHDIGKVPTTKIRHGKITSYDHDTWGERMAKDFLEAFNADINFIRAVSKLVRWHMQILFVVKDMPFKDIENMKKETDVNDVALLGLCDRLGRAFTDEKYRQDEEENVRKFINIVS